MTDTTGPTYPLTGMSDEQWEKQLNAQKAMHQMEVNSTREIELEKLRNQREDTQGRRRLAKDILSGLACLLVVLTFLAGGIYAIQASSQRSHDKAVECIRSGSKWIDERGGGERCERP